MSTDLLGSISVPKIYRPGLGDSPASSGCAAGSLLPENGNIYYYSSSFFGENMKDLLPNPTINPQFSFGRRRSHRRSRIHSHRHKRSHKKKNFGMFTPECNEKVYKIIKKYKTEKKIFKKLQKLAKSLKCREATDSMVSDYVHEYLKNKRR